MILNKLTSVLVALVLAGQLGCQNASSDDFQVQDADNQVSSDSDDIVDHISNEENEDHSPTDTLDDELYLAGCLRASSSQKELLSLGGPKKTSSYKSAPLQRAALHGAPSWCDPTPAANRLSVARTGRINLITLFIQTKKLGSIQSQ